MISITGKKWLEQKTNNNSIEKLKQDHNFSNILSKLIVSRDFDQEEIFSIENNCLGRFSFSCRFFPPRIRIIRRTSDRLIYIYIYIQVYIYRYRRLGGS